MICLTHLRFGNFIYDQALNSSLDQKIKSLKYNAVLAFAGGKNIYQELGLDSHQQGRWYRKLFLF